jgi:signal transduction histidine kinase
MQTDHRFLLLRSIFILIALIAPVLMGYVVYQQASAPALDCALDWQTGIVLAVPLDSHANYAGLQPGDVILNVNGVALADWKTLAIENQPAEIQRGAERLTLELPILSYARLNLPFLLNAIFVTLTFWGIGTLLLWRRHQQYVARLFFLLTQSIAVGLLFFLAYPQTASRPEWMAWLISVGFHLGGALAIHFYLTFPIVLGTPRQRRALLTIVYSLMLVALACRLSGTGWGLRVSFLYNTVEIIGAVAILVYAYLRRATPDARRRLRLVVLGGLAPTVPAFFFYLLPTIAGSADRLPDWMIGPLIIISPLGYLLAIARDNLFDIDRILNRALVYAILSFGILLLYLGPFLLLYRFLPDDWLAQFFIIIGLTLFVGLSFDWTRVRVQRGVDRFFYGGWYDYPGVVETISDALARCIERAQLTDVLTRQVPALMQLDEGHLVEWSNRQIVKPPDDATTRPGDAELEFPLAFQNETRAVWRAGAHRDGEDFTAADRRILATIARQAETALGNVLLVETLRAQLDEIRASRETLAQAQRQLLRSREEERARLARDLHDGPIQDLVGLNMQLGLLLAENASPAESLSAMRAQVRALLAELRQVCLELRPPMLDTLGLGAALRAHAEEWQTQNNVAIQLTLPPDAALRALPSEVAVNLYRVAQEVLTNVARHAHARNVALQLTFENARLALTIRDDGRGFNVPAALHELAAREHFGLMGLHERVELIGGALTIESAPGAGTQVQVVWRMANSV